MKATDSTKPKRHSISPAQTRTRTSHILLSSLIALMLACGSAPFAFAEGDADPAPDSTVIAPEANTSQNELDIESLDLEPIESTELDTSAPPDETLPNAANPATTENVSPSTSSIGLRAIPTYDNGTWTITSGADLHYAVENATSDDVFLIMNDLYMGEDLGLVSNVVNPDGIAEELLIDKDNMNLTFRSGTGGKVTIYRIDHRRHMYVGSPNSNSHVVNVSLTFEDVILDGQQSYDVNAARDKEMSASSRGGIALYYLDGITVSGADVRNCFSEVMNVNTGPDGSQLGRDQICNGGGVNGWYVNDFLFEDCSFTDNVSGTIGGGLHLQSSSGTFDRCTITGNAAIRPSDRAQGGGIYIGNGSGPRLITLKDSTVSNNRVAGYSLSSYSGKDWPTTGTNPDHGGGIIVNDGCSLSLENTTIEGNQADQGGGVYFGGAYTLALKDGTKISGNKAVNTHTFVEGSTTNYNYAFGGGLVAFYGATFETEGSVIVDGNTAESSTHHSFGGGMYLSRATATLADGLSIVGNSAAAPIGKTAGGGGIYSSAQTALTAQDGIAISDNQAKLGGGAYLSFSSGGSASFAGTVFNGNKAVLGGDDKDTGFGCGGAIYTTAYANLQCTAAEFSGNTAEYGGFYLDPADTDYDATIATYNANITGTVSLSAPFTVAAGNYAYNNYDIDYTGTVPVPSNTRNLNVARLFGADRFETSRAVSTYGLDDSCETVILASGDDYNFPDALTASSLSGIEDNAPIVLTRPNELSATARDTIENELKPSRIIIMGDENAVSDEVAAEVAALPSVTSVERIGGEDRMDTADLLFQSRDRSEFSNTAIIALSMNFPDSLSISSWAAHTKSPIFLAHFWDTDLSEKTKAALATGGFTRVLVLGSNLSVSDEVEQQAADLTGAEVIRLGGEDRYETAVLVAKWATDAAVLGSDAIAADNVAITRGDKHADALTGGALQGRSASVILLTPPDSMFGSAHDFIVANQDTINEIRFFGDEYSVALDVVKQFIQCIQCDDIVWKPDSSCALDMS